MWFREHTPIDARVAISTHGTHFRPEMALAGRGIMTSYVGYVPTATPRPSRCQTHSPFDCWIPELMRAVSAAPDSLVRRDVLWPAVCGGVHYPSGDTRTLTLSLG